MRILFLKEQTTFNTVPNLSLAMGILGTMLKANGHELRMVDNNTGFTILPPKVMLSHVESFKPDVLLFSLSPLNALRTYALVREIKARHPHLPLVGGGIHAKFCYEESVRHGFDMVLRGEGEMVIEQIVQAAALFHDKPRYHAALEAMPYIAHPGLDAEGMAKVQVAPMPVDLDQIPFIDYTLFDLEHYELTTVQERGIFNTLYTQRGCPYTCTFCADEIQLKSVRVASARYMFDNMVHCYRVSGNPYFNFCDNVFTLSRKRTLEFCALMEHFPSQEKISFACQTSIQVVDQEVVTALKKAGCVSVALGVERLTEESRYKMMKKIPQKRVEAAIDMFYEAGINVDCFLLVGMPFDNRALLEEERRQYEAFSDKLGYPVVNTLMPMPGTVYYDDYPSTREWYLNQDYIDEIYSTYSDIFDTRFFRSFQQANFFNHSKDDLEAIKELVIGMRKLRTAKKTKDGSLFIKASVLIDYLVGETALLVFKLNRRLERKLFSWYPKFRLTMMRLLHYGQ